LTGFTEANSDNMLIPFEKDLTGAPVFGDTVAKGTGEDQDFRWLRSYINQTRKVVKAQSGKMSDFRARKLKLIENAKPKLVKWWSKYINQDIFRSFYEGLGSNLSASKDYDALGVYKRYHPNVYCNDGGVLTTCGTEKQFSTAAQLDTAVGVTDTGLTVAIVRSLAVKCLQLKIDKIVGKNGYKFWVLVVHPQQLKTLKNDTDYEAATNSAFSTHKGDHPMLNGAVCEIEGFAIFSDIVGIRGWDDATGRFFGDDDTNPIDSMFEPTAITDNYCAIVFGNQAVGFGVVESLGFGDEVDDFANVKEVAGIMIYGANRADFVTEALAIETSGGMFYKDTTGGVVADTACINDSSLIMMTED
jgi:N4-gp56 family major capsid protein